ncbi:MAG TPA: PepSY-associated TM helix domain-containing protein [Polyangia bacterium]
MNNRFRVVLFWLHLAVGVTVGLIVALMSATGAALAFDAQIRAWAEGDSSRVVPPDPAVVLPADEVLARVRAARPNATVNSLSFPSDRTRAVRVSLGREVLFVDPYRGDVRPSSGQTTSHVLGVLVRWHRYLGAEGDGRDLGKAITGAANAGFLFLALSGLILWLPRRWTARTVRAVSWFRRGLGGKARDFNWHNVIGFWSVPVLLVLTFSGLMISYRPVTALIYRVAGETPPVQGAPAAPPPVVPTPPAGAKPLAIEPLLAVARAQVPDWTTMNVRLPNNGGRGKAGATAPPFAIGIKAPSAGPPFASINLSLDPYTGNVLKDERFAGFGPGRRTRTWLRFLHTGEALGVIGQFIAGLVSLGAVVLVYTGFALAWRRWRASVARKSGVREPEPTAEALG